jgi:excisionase family DNA binding protein
MSIEPLWTVADVASYLGVSERTVRVWQTHGRIPFVKIGGTVRFNREDLVAWAESLAEGSRSASSISH